MTTPLIPQPDPSGAAPPATPRPPRRPRPPSTPSPAGGAQSPFAPPAAAPTTPVAPTWGSAPAPTPAPPAPSLGAIPQAPAAPATPYTAGAQYKAATALQDAGQAPDRVALAKQSLADLTTSGQPAFDAAQRQVGRNAAKFGRIGAGQTTNELDDLALARQRSLDTTASQLATDAAGKTMDDRLNLSKEALAQYSAFKGADQGDASLSLQDKLGSGQLDVSRQNANTSANSAAAEAALGAGRLGLDTATGLGSLDINRGRLGLDVQQEADTVQGSQADRAQRQLENDRGFFLDDRTAAAQASLGGTDFNTGGVGGPDYAPRDYTPAAGGYSTGPDGTLVPTGTLGKIPLDQTPGSTPGPYIDPKAVNADPVAFAKWQQGAAAAGYDPNTGRPLAAV